jgi:hypothetical protein
MEEQHLSDIQMEFHIWYHMSSGQAQLKVKSHSNAAEDYGVQYQLGYQLREENNPRLSLPMSIEAARKTDLQVNILHGEALIVRMVDKDGKGLAAIKIDRTNWPHEREGDIVTVQYFLPVPQERIA